MRPPRNPFRLRAAEHIDDNWQFLSLCEPGLLELLPKDHLWDRPVIVRSSAGGGKTTLLRLFTPGPLRMLHAKGGRDDKTAGLYRQLSARGVLTREAPTVAAALVTLAGKYTPLEQLTTVDPGQRLRAFMALLNARVLMAAMRAHLALAGLRYPDDLGRVTIGAGDHIIGHLRLPASGVEVYEWARSLERQVAAVLSSLGPPDEGMLPGDDELTCLEVLGPGSISIDGNPASARTVVLLDDVHRLAAPQRGLLFDTLLARRAPTPVWLAERRAALTPEELLSEGSKHERDVVVIDIEKYWRGSRRQGFQKLVTGVADRRTLLAPEASASSFEGMLGGVDEQAWGKIVAQVEERLLTAAGGRQEFSSWIDARTDPDAGPRDRAIGMRALEIRIARELAATQMTLDLLVRDESALEDLDRRREANDVREAAELFLCREFELPYYFGVDKLAQLAFANVDQFLEFSGDLFEELSGTTVLRREPLLVPGRQEQLIVNSVKDLWATLGSAMHEGARIRGLMEGFGQYCAERTYLPNAPYAPGVTGLALRRSHAEGLQEACDRRPDSWEGHLGRILAALVAHNHVSVQASEAKGQRWVVYYLNRAWCVRYRLPLSYGGWQSTTPEQMWAWSLEDQVRTTPRMAAA